jgi:integrase
MGKRHNPRGKRFRPLEKEEIEQYEKAARDCNDTLTELTALTPLHTGLRAGEFSHLRESWLASAFEEDHGILRVPGEEECIGGASAVGRSRLETEKSYERSAACYTCRNTRDSQWKPKAQIAIREIPIINKSVYKLLVDWFETHKQIPLLHSAVDTRVQHVAELAELSRQVKPCDLRHTYEAMLAYMGMDEKTIAAVMGYSSPHMVRNTDRFSDLGCEFNRKWADEDRSNSDDN